MNVYEKIEQLINEKNKVIIAIDGPSAAGKSTFSKKLAKQYNASLFHTDNYFLPKVRKTVARLIEIGGNVDYERIQDEIFNNMNNDIIISNYYNCKLEVLGTKEPIYNTKVLIVEGVYSMHPTLIDNYDLLIYLDVDSKIQLKRIVDRNGSNMLEKWINEWIPLENMYFKETDIKHKADFIITV